MKKKTEMPFVDLDNARKDEQKKVMKDIIDAGHCPFCSENLRKYHKKPIIKETTYWLVTTNQWPYDNTKHHFLLIYKKHAIALQELDLEAGKELFEISGWLTKEYLIPGGGLVMRFGDTNYSAGTVAHMHAQFVVPDIKKEGFESVRIKIGKKR